MGSDIGDEDMTRARSIAVGLLLLCLSAAAARAEGL